MVLFTLNEASMVVLAPGGPSDPDPQQIGILLEEGTSRHPCWVMAPGCELTPSQPFQTSSFPHSGCLYSLDSHHCLVCLCSRGVILMMSHYSTYSVPENESWGIVQSLLHTKNHSPQTKCEKLGLPFYTYPPYPWDVPEVAKVYWMAWSRRICHRTRTF